MKLTKKNVGLCFQKIIDEYSKKVASIKKPLKNVEYISLKGFNVIIHVFQISLINTGDLDASYLTSCNAFYLYIEFIEQMSDIAEITIMDAIKFVYEKTISTQQQNNDTIQDVTEILEGLKLHSGQMNDQMNDQMLNT